jgi:RNA polymerase sigma-70 factor, ECF subfamily
LQAELAAVHVTAPTWESTDWARIVATYDALAEVSPSPIVGLNRAIAISMLAGPSVGLASLTALERPLAKYHLFYAARADMLERSGGDPRPDLERALSLATNEAERRLIERRLRDRLARTRRR